MERIRRRIHGARCGYEVERAQAVEAWQSVSVGRDHG
jgi:hypothetical protein